MFGVSQPHDSRIRRRRMLPFAAREEAEYSRCAPDGALVFCARL